ncbi:MAG: LptF/LptG family permease [Candidatus Margulisbacteria bacterium]|jgi:lipopolysaccharide export system permease protein|nr:LptF/LptG family permease [Candidatus Margulisiibacteriota bacterium]
MFKEIFTPFLFGLAAFTTIIAGGAIIPGVINEARMYNLAFPTVCQLFVLRLPGILSWIFPMATLLAALLSFSRLSSESELTAFRAGGISLYKLTAAPLLFGVLISIVTILFNETITPQAAFAAENLIIQLKDIARSAPQIRENVNIPMYENGQMVRLLHARRVEGGRMHDVHMVDFAGGEVARTTRARTAEFDPARGWSFQNGVAHQFAGDNRSALVIDFQAENINLNINPRDVSGRDKDVDQMDLLALGKYISQQRNFGSPEVPELRVKWHQKLAVPFACFIFVILGSTMGIRPQRSSSSVGLGISVLVLFLYYVLLSLFGMIGALSPVLAAWLPKLLIGFYGFAALCRKASV